MSDPISIAAAYTIVLGGLGLYVWSIVRRIRAARRMTAALERERAHDDRDAAAVTSTPTARPIETQR